MYPDEIDTPMDQPARTRFARYRGLQSFRSSPWDAKENLPREYARIFEFENYTATRKVLHEDYDEMMVGDHASPGDYVTLDLRGVGPEVAANIHERVTGADGAAVPAPLVLAGLLPHENQMTVVHAVVQRPLANRDDFEADGDDADEAAQAALAAARDVVRCKDTMVVHVGFRRYVSRPIYSDHNTQSDKSKVQRFMPPAPSFCVASMFAPACFTPNCPVMLYRPDGLTEQGSAGSPTLLQASSAGLVAMGSLLTCDANRIMLKRVVLSGYPFKLHKTRGVIRYMFFSKADIAWFKPIELFTKQGYSGHIRASIGTHGHMKCQFSDHLRQNDVVCMALYKRQFPPEWNPAWFQGDTPAP